jgi:hypothetical protein
VSRSFNFTEALLWFITICTALCPFCLDLPFVYKLYNVGPSREPWGTPASVFFKAPLINKVILRTPMRTRSNTFSDALFRTHFFGHTFQGMDRGTICWSIGLFSIPFAFPLFSSLGSASTRKPRLGQKNALYGLDTQIIIVWTVHFSFFLGKMYFQSIISLVFCGFVVEN